MSNYDASIRVNTEIDNSNLLKLQVQIDKAVNKVSKLSSELSELKNKKIPTQEYEEISRSVEKAQLNLDRLIDRQDKMVSLGKTSGSAWDSLQYDIEAARNTLEYAKADMQDLVDAGKAFTLGAGQNEIAQKENELAIAQAELQALKVKLDETVSKFREADNSAKNFFGGLRDGTKKSNNLLTGLTRRLKNLAIRLLLFRWIIKGYNAMLTGMKEGFQNLAQYSTNYNKTLSELKSQTATLKNSFAAAFEPIADIVVSNFTRLVTWINKAMDAMAQFIAVLQGKSTYTKAKKQVIDYAKSLDTASKSAKKALASFDELKVLNKSDSADSGNGELTGADAFEEAEINPEIYEMLEKVKKLLEYIAPLAVAVGIALLAWKIASFLKDLGSVAANLKDAYGIIMFIAGVALLVYHYFNMWKDGVDWEGIKGYIAGVAMAVLALYLLFGPLVAGIALIVLGIAGLVLAFKDMCENGFTAENMVLALVSAVMIVVGVFIAFGAVAALVVGAVLAVIGIFAAMIIWAGNGEESLDRLFGSFLKNVFAGDWKAAFKDIVAFAIEGLNQGNILIESIINCIIKGLNWLIEQINK